MKNKIIELRDIKVLDATKANNYILKNINIDFYQNQCVVISSRKDSDFEACKKIIEIIARTIQSDGGTVNYNLKNNTHKYVLGYNNFDNILSKDVKVSEVLLTLIKTEKLDSKNQEEINEVIKLFSLEKILDTKIIELDFNQKHLLNIVLLLIIKPRILLSKGLSLPGSTTFQVAALKFLKTYLDKYDVTLIISTNDTVTREQLYDRLIEIENTKIVNDSSVVFSSSLNKNDVDNKTKKFDLSDLESELLSSLKSSEDQWRNDGRDTNELLIKKEITKSLNLAENKPINIAPPPPPPPPLLPKKTNVTKRKSLDTESLMDDLDKVIESKKQNIDNINQKMNNSTNLVFNNEEQDLKTLTKELKIESENLIEEIKLNIPTKKINEHKLNITDAAKIHYEINDEIVQDLVDTYIIRKQLEQQIKSEDFIKLSVELQNKVFDNYERANHLIHENDPKGLYDPSRTSQLHMVQDEANILSKPTSSITRMIINEDLHNDYDEPKDQRIQNIYKSKTSEFQLEDDEVIKPLPNDKTLNSILEDVSTDELFDNDDDFIPKKTQKAETLKIMEPSDLEEENNSNFYHDNNKKNKPFFKFFNKHPTPKYDGNSVLDGKVEKKYTTPLFQVEDPEMDDNESFEPRHNTALFKSAQSNIEAPTIPAKPPVTNIYKTASIKQRVKKNKIEALYYEALDDQEIAQDLKNQEDNE